MGDFGRGISLDSVLFLGVFVVIVVVLRGFLFVWGFFVGFVLT